MFGHAEGQPSLTIFMIAIIYLVQTNYGITESPRLYSKQWRSYLFNFISFLSSVVFLPVSVKSLQPKHHFSQNGTPAEIKDILECADHISTMSIFNVINTCFLTNVTRNNYFFNKRQ